MKLRIKKGDIVRIISGNDKGASGRVLELFPKQMKILIEGVNLRKKHMRPNQQNQKGGIISKELPIHYSNVMLMDADKNPTRLGIRREEKDGKKVSIRYAKTNDKSI